MNVYRKILLLLKTAYIKLFLLQRKILNRLRYKKRIRKKISSYPLFKSTKKDIEYLKKSKTFLKQNWPGFSDVQSHFYFSTLNNIKKVEYISSELFFTAIEPVLNHYQLSTAFTDKIAYDSIFAKEQIPETVFKIINNKFYDADNNLIQKDTALNCLKKINGNLVLKPALISGGGKNIRITDSCETVNYLQKNSNKLKGSFILQKAIIQHKLLASFHPGSVNTCRIMTARVNSEIVVLSALFRMGRNNSKVDNGSSGGIMCSIDFDGNISDYGIDQANNKYYKHPETGIPFKGFQIPNYKKARDFCLNKHKRFLRYTFISWDIGIKENGDPVFIEFNIKTQAIKEHQILNGPLFGKYYPYFVELYKEEKKNYGLYF